MPEVTPIIEESALKALFEGIAYTHLANVPGDVVEFGCYWGHSAKLLAHAMEHCEKGCSQVDRQHGYGPRKLWLFDSFEGLPEATAETDKGCPHVQAGAWTWKLRPEPGKMMPSPEHMYRLCGKHLPPDRMMAVKGWYKDTLTQIPAGTKFAFVHIDCDLYESTYQVLDHLFGHDHLSDGCAIYFDDWYCNRGNPKWGEQKAWRDIWQGNSGHYHALGYSYSDWGPYAILGRRFIVHC